MAGKSSGSEYHRGVRAAELAIEEDRVFWISAGDEEEDEERADAEHIDPRTGVPFLVCSGETDDFIRGHNDTVLKASRAGEIKSDFRPLRMTYREIAAAFKKTNLGSLSRQNPQIIAPNGEFELELRPLKSSTRPRKTPGPPRPPRTYICFRNRVQEWPQWDLYDDRDEPTEYGIGREGRVMILKNSEIYLTIDIRTTQVLDRYPLR